MARIVKEQKERMDQILGPAGRMAKEQHDRYAHYTDAATRIYKEQQERMSRIVDPISRMLKKQEECHKQTWEPLQKQVMLANKEAALVTKGLAEFDRLINKSAIPEYAKNITLIQKHYDNEYKRFAQPGKDLADSVKRWAKAMELVQTELPKMGWYLTGKEPGRTSTLLAKYLEEGNWEAVHELMVKQAFQLPLDIDKFAKWLDDHSVPESCINRVRCFMRHFKAKNHEEATLIGVPLIDELSRTLYGGRDFTSKGKGKHKKTRPAIAEPRKDGKESLTKYAIGFVRGFGLFQDNWDETKFADENYFNRHAISHGVMKRSYGPKDSAKTFMAIMFVATAFNEEETSS